MNSIDNSVTITLLQTKSPDNSYNRSTGQGSNGKAGESVKGDRPYPPEVINDSLGHLLKSLQVVNPIKDTTGAILEEIKAQMEGKGINVANLNSESANAKSLQVGQDLSLQSGRGLVQMNKEILRQLQS